MRASTPRQAPLKAQSIRRGIRRPYLPACNEPRRHGSSTTTINDATQHSEDNPRSADCQQRPSRVQLELGERGIRVNAISPGLVETPLVTALTSAPAPQAEFTDNTPLRRNGQPREHRRSRALPSLRCLLVDHRQDAYDVNGGAHLRRYPDVMKHLAAL